MTPAAGSEPLGGEERCKECGAEKSKSAPQHALEAILDPGTVGDEVHVFFPAPSSVVVDEGTMDALDRLADAAGEDRLPRKATPPSSVVEQGGLRENPDAKALIDGWHLTNGAIDAMNAALSKSFAIYDDPEAGTDVDGDSVTVMDRLMDNGYVVASWDAIREALTPKAGIGGGYSWDCPNCGERITSWIKPPDLASVGASSETPDTATAGLREQIVAMKMAAVYPDGRPDRNSYAGGWDDALDEVLLRLTPVAATPDLRPGLDQLAAALHRLNIPTWDYGRMRDPHDPNDQTGCMSFHQEQAEAIYKEWSDPSALASEGGEPDDRDEPGDLRRVMEAEDAARG